MALVTFYEKPGCANNRLQKQLLREAGHIVIAKDLLTHTWKATDLMRFFGNLPVSEWFNPNAPAIKAGDVMPEKLIAEDALRLMVAQPLLIRRPLMQVDESTMVGFNREAVHAWVGLARQSASPDLETCPRSKSGSTTSCLITERD